MKVPKSTVRLQALVRECGQPEPVTLWTKPQEDKGFQKAVAQNRILTVTQEPLGTRKDFGVVGFHKGKNLGYWVFPKSLDAFEGKRVIGLDYSLLKVPVSTTSTVAGSHRSTHPKAPLPQPTPPPAKPGFMVTIRCVSTVDITQQVEARNPTEAKAAALAKMAREQVDFARGTQSRVAVRVEKLTNESRNAASIFRRIRGLPDLPDSSAGGRH